MTNNSLPYIEILDIQRHLHELQYEHWLRYELFTWQWWMLLGMLTLPWFLWWRFADKTRTAIILSYGLYLVLVVTAMDWIGAVLQWWIYPIKLTPILPFTIPLDWGMVPVTHMLIYQYFPRWKSFLVAETIVAALGAFVAESLGEWAGIYLALHWYHHWSFPVYIMKAVIGKWLIERIVYCR